MIAVHCTRLLNGRSAVGDCCCCLLGSVCLLGATVHFVGIQSPADCQHCASKLADFLQITCYKPFKWWANLPTKQLTVETDEVLD